MAAVEAARDMVAISRLVTTANRPEMEIAWPGHAFGRAEVVRDRREQAHRHELGGDQEGDAQRHGADGAPGGAAADGVGEGRGVLHGTLDRW
jgi:hypothetical protein